MSEHNLIHDDKSTHISLMSVDFHTHDDNTIHMFHRYACIFTYMTIIQYTFH